MDSLGCEYKSGGKKNFRIASETSSLAKKSTPSIELTPHEHLIRSFLKGLLISGGEFSRASNSPGISPSFQEKILLGWEGLMT